MDLPTPNKNISIPFGLVAAVEHYLGSAGVLDLVNTFKERGVPMDRIVVSMCVHMLMGNNSMAQCGEWLSDPNVRRELGIDSNLGQRTINRAIEIIGQHSDEILVQLWKGLDSRYRFENTDVNIDGSAVVFNGPKSALGAIGYNRDFRDQSRPQVEFMTAELQQSRIPFFIRAYPGNESDAEQYRNSLPTIFDMIHKGSWIIMDNGGAAGDILDSIVKSGNRYITRTRLNASDEKRILKEGGSWEYVEDGVCCIRHTFDSSGRTTFLFWSYENWKRSRKTAERNVKRMIDAVRTYQDGKFRASDFVTVRKNVIADVQVKVGIQSRFDFDDPDEVEGLVREVMGPMAGIFKLESSEQLTPLEALQKYRARATVEHLIHSLKRVSGIKPLRVWNESSIRGSMMLALLSETAVAMARYEMQPRTKTIGGKEVDDGRPSTESMVWSLSHLTVTRIIGKTGRGRPVYSNWDAISTEVFGNIKDELMRKSTFSMQEIGRNLSFGLS